MRRRSARLSSDNHHHIEAVNDSSDSQKQRRQEGEHESASTSARKGKRASEPSATTLTASATKKLKAEPIPSTTERVTRSTAAAKGKGKARARSPSPLPSTSSRPAKKRKTVSTTTTSRTLRPRNKQTDQQMGRKGSRATARAQRAKGLSTASAAAANDDEDDFSFEFDHEQAASSSNARTKNRFAASTSKAAPIDVDDQDQHVDPEDSAFDEGHESNSSGGDGSENDDEDDDGEDEEEEYETTLGLHGDEMDEDEDSEIHEAPETVDADGSPLDRGDGFASGLRALQGIMTGMSNRLKTILNALRSKDVDPTAKLMTLQDLAEILSIGTEDTLAGFFQTEAFTKELVAILKGDAATGTSGEGSEGAMSAEEAIAFGLDPMEIGITGGMDEESNVQMMLLACRCLANMMEALPGSAHSVVYAGAVPVLCSKLKEIQYIDLAEQTMSTLEKISEEMPSSIVREGGLNALLQYLDFFSFHVQRTAVTAAANCCRSLSIESFDKVKEVMPIVRNVLSYPDQRVVEQGSLAVVRIIESYRHHPEKLELLVDAELLSSIKTLLNPDASTLGQRTYTQLLKMLATASRASPVVAVTIIEKGFGDTLYHLLTGVAPPRLDSAGQLEADNGKRAGEDDALVMQNLVQRPREQVQETLNLVAELLPPLPRNEMFDSRTYAKDRSGKAKVKQEASEDKATDQNENRPSTSRAGSSSSRSRDPAKEAALEKRLAMFRDEQRQDAVLRFFNLLLSTLVEVYSASVQSHVRTKSVQAIVKIIAAADTAQLRDMLTNVPMASFLSAILSSRDNQSTVLTSCLQIVELLLTKLPDMYQYRFRKEGVLHEVERLAARSLLVIQSSSSKSSPSRTPKAGSSSSAPALSGLSRALQGSTLTSTTTTTTELQATDSVTLRARHVRDVFNDEGSETAARAQESLDNVRRCVNFLGSVLDNDSEDAARRALERVFDLFAGPEGPLSSFEMLDSRLVENVLHFATDPDASLPVARRRELLAHALMPQLDGRPATPAFALLVKRLQESLSRMEEFEVELAASSPAEDAKRNPSSMLARQLRLRLIAEEGSDVPKSCSNIVVSIHAIATFQAFNDYLRPRILAATGDRAGGGNASGTLSGLLAAFAAANGMSPPPDTVGSLSASASSFANASKLSSSADASVIHPETSAASSSSTSQPAPLAASSSAAVDTSAKPAKPAQPARRRSTRLSKKFGSADADEPVDEAVARGTGEDERPVDVEQEGGKLVAHTPGGTRIGTPQPDKSSTQALPQPKSRPSYAAALKTEPTDFHLEFKMGDRDISLDTTIYGAVHGHEAQLPEHSRSPNMWQSIYTVRFKKVAGPARSSTQEQRAASRNGTILTDLPSSIPADREQAKILQLLWLLHSINSEQSDAYDGANAGLPESSFVNNKITAKLNRQLEEPMIVASACLPDWATDLPTYVPFLFPFETRYTFLQSTSFGYARLMQKWIGNGRSSGSSSRDENLGFLGRLTRQKVRISRERILESAFKVFDLYGDSRASLEVEFFDEVGSGLGPTLEFYALVSKEFSRRSLNLWRSDDTVTGDFVFAKNGLFPAPIVDATSEDGKKTLKTFRMLGQFVAKALMDSRIIDVHLSKAFARLIVDGELPQTVNSIRSIDSGLAKSLSLFEKYSTSETGTEIDGMTLEDLAIDFTLPGYDIELKPGGKDVMVNHGNVREYIDLVIDWTSRRGVESQAAEFRAGFSSVFPVRDLQSFTPAEIVMMTSALDEDWTVENLMTATKADHGYTMDSRAVQDILLLMSEFNPAERRAFLSFITGSPRLPIGGFSALTPPLTIVRKDGGDSSLPSVMTCVNYIKLPDYSSREVLKERFKTAVYEGAGGFHLS